MSGPGESRAELRRSLTRVTVAGSLFMVYFTATNCPLVTDFFLTLGATDLHFGLLNGLPSAMVGWQIVGAYLSNRLARRKPVFVAANILGRSLYLLVVALPLWWPVHAYGSLILTQIALIATAAALGHLVAPLWFSWMADLVPRRVLNRYWGVRQRWMQLTWATAFLAVTLFTYVTHWPAHRAYTAVVVVAVAAGMVDMLLFLGVREPPHEQHRGAGVLQVLLEPFRHRQYRTYAWFWSLWIAGVMPGAAFMQVYALKVLGLEVWEATLIWCLLGAGTAISSPAWGRLADRHGHRPILVTCIALKPWIVLVFLLMTPGTVRFVLPLAYLIDANWNAGIMVASNGYMLKISPRRNRSMFIAAIISLSGLAGGLAVIAAGRLLESMEGLSFTWAWVQGTNYHIIFAVSFLARLLCVPLALRIREPRTTPPAALLNVIVGVGMGRFLRFPVGLYQNLRRTRP